MFSIHLNQLQFYSYHGLYEEEKVIGGVFEVNAIVIYNITKENSFKINDCLNYVALYEIIKTRMSKPTELLENIANEIAQTILAQFSQVTEVDISITKKNPPIHQCKGNITVRMNKKR